MIFVIQAAGAVTKHYDRVQAKIFGQTCDAAVLVVGAPEDLPEGDALLDLYWLLEPAAAGLVTATDHKAVYDLLKTKYQDLPFMEPTDLKVLPPNPTVEQGTENMEAAQEAVTAKTAKAPKAAAAKKTTKPAAAAKAAKVAAPKKSRGKGKPAGKVADFKQVLKGSKRANILELMTGAHTAEAIGVKLGIEPSLVSSNVFCLSRDCGIGYEYGAGGEIKAIFPGNKTVADALKISGTPPKAKAAAKKSAAKKTA